eukprot:PhF_6_TR4721/c0_g1_i1/m.6538/K01106/E3.1.3.56; inositol-1,4,5-trisphosphate 5-phosphatase
MVVTICVATQNIGCLDNAIPLEVDKRTVVRMRLLFESLTIWLEKSRPDVFVLHLQEIGGKRHHGLFQELLASSIRGAIPASEYWCSGLLMSLEANADFTAIGSVIWVRSTCVSRTKIREFSSGQYVPLPAVIEPNPSTKYHYGWKLSEAEKSRKGLVITSLEYDSRKFFFVNVHLYHDQDNVVAMSKSPSEYAEKRTRGMVETMEKLMANGATTTDSIFIFGDLNTRLDGCKFIQHHNTSAPRVTVRPKCVDMPEELWELFSSSSGWPHLKQFDEEGQRMMDTVASKCNIHLCELPRNFGPTYSLCNEEGTTECGTYKEERLPAWCDRVFANASALTSVAEFQYWVCPLHVLDHRGVYLMFSMLD